HTQIHTLFAYTTLFRSYVLPPKMEASTATLAEIAANMDALGYQYVYDQRNRLVEKQVPGKGREHIVYNKLDLPVMTQDGVQRTNGEWLFTKYVWPIPG